MADANSFFGYIDFLISKKGEGTMKGVEKKGKMFFVFLVFSLSLSIPSGAYPETIIIDHTCTDISHIPESWINEARADFRISYGHTSHGSQIVTGMDILKNADDSLYDYNHDGSGGALSFHDYEPSGDLGNPDRTTWERRTRDLLDSPGNDRNLIMWSWCGQVSSATEYDINTYLTLMNQLEIDYPDVTFVYMTGHLDGTGESGNLNVRNNQIRDYCAVNDKILFDFADIESYDPSGSYFLDRGADDACDYDGGNWADEWCAAHPGECESCDCAHSRCLNCQLKGKAFWWMMARLAGWNPGTSTTTTTGSSTTTTAGTDTTTNGGCFSEEIYGEYSDETELLRFLRDSILSNTPEGQELIRLYYEWSPAVVRAIKADEEFKEGVKTIIDGILPLIQTE